MQLYTKVTQGKRVRYIPYQQPQVECTEDQLVTILSSLTISMLTAMEKMLPAHKAVARRVKAVEEDLCRLAQLKAGGLDEEHIEMGTAMWNAAIECLQGRLAPGASDGN